MVDKIKPLKFETPEDGSQFDEYQTETNPNEDYIAAKGIALENKDSHLVDIVDNDISFKSPVSGRVSLNELIGTSTGGLTEAQHNLLDQLIHNIAENSFYEVTYDTGKVSSEIWYTDDTKSIIIRSIEYTYSGNNLTQIVTKQYDSDGYVKQTYTETVTYDIGRVSTITGVFS